MTHFNYETEWKLFFYDPNKGPLPLKMGFSYTIILSKQWKQMVSLVSLCSVTVGVFSVGKHTVNKVQCYCQNTWTASHSHQSRNVLTGSCDLSLPGKPRPMRGRERSFGLLPDIGGNLERTWEFSLFSVKSASLCVRAGGPRVFSRSQTCLILWLWKG